MTICIRIFLSIYVSMYLYIYVSKYLPWLSNDPLFLGSFKKKTCFSESTCLEIKYCFLHVGDGHSWRWAEAAEIKKCATLPTWNSLLQVLFWFWMIESAGEKISKALVLVYVWCHGFDLPCFDSWARFALSFCTHEGRSQHSVADMRVHCSILVTNIPGKICPDNANMQSLCKGLFFLQISNVLFLCRGPSGRRPKVRKKASKVRKYPSSLDPSEPKDIFSENVPFFHCPSVHLSKLCQQLAPQGQGEWMCSIPVCVLQKCRNVQMFAPAAHCKKRAKVSYLDRNRGSKVVLPRSFSHTSHTPGPETMCEVPDPTSGRTSTKRSHDLV